MDFMMQIVFMSRHAVPDSVIESDKWEPTPLQDSIKVGDFAISLRDEGLFNDIITLIKVLDPESSNADDWADRVSRHFMYCEWVSMEHRTPEVGWFHRAVALPIDEKTADDIKWHLDNTKEEDWAEYAKFPVADRAYRTWSAESADRLDDATPIRCEKCYSHQVEVRAEHTAKIHGSGLWKTLRNGEVVLWPTSRAGSCDVAARLECLDCGWKREVDKSEIHHHQHPQ